MTFNQTASLTYLLHEQWSKSLALWRVDNSGFWYPLPRWWLRLSLSSRWETLAARGSARECTGAAATILTARATVGGRYNSTANNKKTTSRTGEEDRNRAKSEISGKRGDPVDGRAEGVSRTHWGGGGDNSESDSALLRRRLGAEAHARWRLPDWHGSVLIAA